MINWDTYSYPVSKYFNVSDCIYLHHWNRLARDIDGLNEAMKKNLLHLCLKLDVVREFFGRPMVSHCMFRSREYNAYIGGAKDSAHIDGLACDFHISTLNCDVVRKALLPHLEEWGFRMEDNPGSAWVHLDLREPEEGHSRYFKP